LEVALVIADGFLRGVLEGSCTEGALAEDLDGLHDVLRLVVVRVAEVGGPGNVVVHLCQDLGERGEGLYAGIPWLLAGRVRDGIGGDIALRLEPVVGADDLGRIGGSSQDLGD